MGEFSLGGNGPMGNAEIRSGEKMDRSGLNDADGDEGYIWGYSRKESKNRAWVWLVSRQK